MVKIIGPSDLKERAILWGTFGLLRGSISYMKEDPERYSSAIKKEKNLLKEYIKEFVESE